MTDPAAAATNPAAAAANPAADPAAAASSAAAPNAAAPAAADPAAPAAVAPAAASPVSLTIPGETATAEERAAFNKALGVPDAPDGYTLKQPEGIPAEAWNAETLTRLRQIGHQAGLTPAQVQALASGFATEAANQMQAEVRRLAEAPAVLEADLRKEFGSDYGRHVELAKRAAQRWADAESLTALETAMGSAPMVKLFARIGAAMGEASLHGGGSSSFGVTTPAEAKAALVAKMRDPLFTTALFDKDHAAHKGTLEEWQRLQSVSISEANSTRT